VQIGIITVDGRQVGVINLVTEDDIADSFISNVEGYIPEGRAERGINAPPRSAPMPSHAPRRRQHRTNEPAPHTTAPKSHSETPSAIPAPKGETFSEKPSRSYDSGSTTTDQAIVDAARAHHLDPNLMRSIASIESGMNPGSNANAKTQYKGLYQIGHDEWRRFGGEGNIYNAHDNAMAAARMFDENRSQFRKRFNRDPTDTELYLMHQQGLGFYTRGAMTNIGGNLPASARTGENMTHEGFERYWGGQVARRKASFAARHGQSAETEKPIDPSINPM
jgi:hypothetical protein